MKKFPDTLMILLVIMLIFLGLTWILPAGEFERTLVNGRTLVVPGTYAHVDPNPQGFWEFLKAPLKGVISGAEIIGFVLLVGASFSVLNATGAINAALMSLIRSTQNKPGLRGFVIPIVMLFFSFCGATFGMSEEVLVFVLITIPLAKALGYDAVVGVAIAFVGAGAGFAGAFLNPFTIGIAQGIAELPQYSGIEYRIVVWAVMTIIAILYVMRYASRIRKDPSRSLLYNSREVDGKEKKVEPEMLEFDTRRKIVVLLLFGILGLMIYGVTSLDWYIEEITALFVAMGFLAALLGKINTEQAIKAFYDGAKEMIAPAIIIALAKALIVIATDGRIIDTVLYGLAGTAEGLSASWSAQIMFFFQSGLNFFMPSGSGQAALTMPLMSPLSDLLGLDRQIAVLAYQFGDGLSNLIIPTSAVTMGVLGIAKIRYDQWIRWMMPLFVVLSLAAMVLLFLPGNVFEWKYEDEQVEELESGQLEEQADVEITVSGS